MSRSMNPRLQRALLSLCLPLVVQASATAAPYLSRAVAQLDKLKSTVQIRSGDTSKACELFDSLHVGDILTVSAKASAEVVYFGSGAHFALQPGSSACVGTSQMARISGPEPKKLAPVPAVAAQSPHVPGFSGRFGGSVQRGAGDADRGPREGRPLWGIRPGPWNFSWTGPIMGPRGETDGLMLKFRVLKDANQRIVWENLRVPVSTLHLHVPNGKLFPGVVYHWSVRLFVGGEPDIYDGGVVRMLTAAETSSIETLELEVVRARRSRSRRCGDSRSPRPCATSTAIPS